MTLVQVPVMPVGGQDAEVWGGARLLAAELCPGGSAGRHAGEDQR